MYNKGEKIINNNGIACVIDRIESMKIPHTKQKMDYYVMNDIVKSDNVYYIPVNSGDSMRYPMTREEAEAFIARIPEIEKITIGAERFRDDDYRKYIRESNPDTLVAMLKFFRERKILRSGNGKTLSAIDEKYMKLAARNLYSELVCSLDISIEEVEALINSKLE